MYTTTALSCCSVSVTFDDVPLVEPHVAMRVCVRGRLVGREAHGGGGGLQRARGRVGVTRAHAARVRDDVARVARALI